jgi:hypothetical protein
MGDRIKCKLCGYTVKRFWRNKDGKLVSGYPSLKDHFMREHYKEFLELQDKLMEEKND